MAYETVVVHPSAARTATGQTGAIPTNTGDKVSLFLNVTAATGTTPTLTVSVEWSVDGTNFGPAETPDAFTQVTAQGAKVKAFDAKAPYYRVVYTIGGTTPSFTFTVTSYTTT